MPHTNLSAPGLGSALLRLLLVAFAIFLLAALPDNYYEWDNDSASVIPSERNMPIWGNYVVAALCLAALGLLIIGWLQRRIGQERTHRSHVAMAWLACVGHLLWAGVLTVSQVKALSNDGGAMGNGIGSYLDGVFALVALGTAVLLARDALKLSR